MSRLFILDRGDDSRGVTEIGNLDDYEPGEGWREATQSERILFRLFKARYSYVDLFALAIAIAVVTVLDLEWWALILLGFFAAMVVVVLEDRYKP